MVWVTHFCPRKQVKIFDLFYFSNGVTCLLPGYGVLRDRQTWKRVLILSCRFLTDGFENRVEITKFVDNFILFQENSNN